MHQRAFRHKPLRIGLTGGIGSGKSTVSQILHQTFGSAVIDADAIAHQITEPHGQAIPSIARIFGAEFININGALNREQMRAYVFNQPTARQTLESIIHPLVTLETDRQELEAIANGYHTLVFDVPLLVEAGNKWRKRVDCVLLVDCQEETQIRRVIARNKISREVIQKIMSTQALRPQRLAIADWVIHNDNITLKELLTCVENLPILT